MSKARNEFSSMTIKDLMSETFFCKFSYWSGVGDDSLLLLPSLLPHKKKGNFNG